MEINIVIKMIICTVVALCLGFFGFFAAAFSLLMGEFQFYTPLIIVTTIALFVFFIMKIFTLAKPRTLKISSLSFLALCVIATVIYEIRESYINNIATVSDQDFNLYGYQPFHEDSSVVALVEPSNLQLESELPILDGATALYPVYSAFARASYPEKEYDVHQSEVMSSQTGEAYRKLIDGVVDIIFAAGPSARQLQMAEEKGVELELTPIGREAFVFFVNEKNPVKGLTVEQIQAIYSGDITNWREVGGNNEAILAFQRPADSGSQTALEKLMGEEPLVEPPTENIASGMGGIIEEVSSYRNYKNAIGFTFRFFSTEMVQNGEVRYLEINGVYPNKETIRNDEYPITSEFYAITAGSDNPNIDVFLQWILSEQGQWLVEETGYVPINN
ncbi:PstS family phosphate ABC transporter substrate-binding protein [Halalkalibacter kiskunsagensis]|uniref:PstS family phosphate ABC transporter substrate-binding protein n=1 Tax=Halalkalibacter kiskunsagensis TaxID=1548599 RepID=A0ABV6K9A9_9BACI